MFGRKALAVIAALALGLGVLGTGSPSVWAASVGSFDVEGNTEDYEYKDRVLRVKNGAVLTISMQPGAQATKDRIVVPSGEATITISNLNIKEPSYGAPISVAAGASLDLRLVGTSTVSGGFGFAGVHVPNGNPKNAVLRISAAVSDAFGKVVAVGGTLGAGIGGNSGGSAGTITVGSGVVEASIVNGSGSGIGGGDGGAGGTVIVNGGKVTATGITGIGGGGGYGGDGGTVTVNGGEVEATGSIGAGIGAGSEYAAGGTLTVTGGTVKAISTAGGAGIGGRGGNPGSSGGDVVIHGGVVTAISNDGSYLGGAGIGGGGSSYGRSGGAGGSVSIYGGTVSATGGAAGGADIGGGSYSSDGGSLEVVAADPKSVPVVKLAKNGSDVVSPMFESADISDQGAGAVGQGIDGLYDADGDRNPGEYSVEQVGGADGSADTTELKVKFGRKMMTGLDKAKFTVDGAAAELKDPDSEFKEFILELPKPFKNGSKVSVKPVWKGWKFTPTSVEVQVFAENPVIDTGGSFDVKSFDPFEVQLSGSHGVDRGELTWSLSDGPSGMKIDAAGMVSWVAKVVPEEYWFTARVEDSYGFTEKQFMVTVVAGDMPQSSWPDGALYVQGSGKSLTWRVDKDLELAADVFMDDTLLSPGSAYQLSSGSTVVGLLPEFLDTQKVGSHVLKVTFVDGTSAQAAFQVQAAAQDNVLPPSGAPGAPVWPAGLLMLILLSAGVVVMKNAG